MGSDDKALGDRNSGLGELTQVGPLATDEPHIVLVHILEPGNLLHTRPFLLLTQTPLGGELLRGCDRSNYI